MELKTFDTILTEMCDTFDGLISPKTITRSNTNIIYLLFKAVAKGFEVINSTCVLLGNKFSPLYCSEEDLESVAGIVGTERLAGSATGLHIIVTNNGEVDLTLQKGTYAYSLDADTRFSFEVLSDTEIKAGSYVTFIAMSDSIGRYPVTAQESIAVESDTDVPADLAFSCTDNSNLLGTEEETDLEFRKRINTTSDRQNSIVELQTALKNLPYLFDCQVRFNDTEYDVDVDGDILPPYTAVIYYSGEARNEIARKIAERIMFPTLRTESSVRVRYENRVFMSGYFEAYITPFRKLPFSVDVTYRIDSVYASETKVQAEIRTALNNAYVAEVHKDFIKEDDIYNVIEGLDLAGVEVLGVSLKHNGSAVNYIEVPVSRIPELNSVRFISE